MQSLCGKMFPTRKWWENVVLNKGVSKTHRGGYGMLPHHDRASMVLYICRMACITQPVAPPRVYTNPMGVKIRKVHGGYVFQPPSLKVSSYLVLD